MNQRIRQRLLKIREGSEGPRHDPYHWSEYLVIINGVEHRLRIGSLGYARYHRQVLDGSAGAFGVVEDHVDHPRESVALRDWEAAVGMTTSQFERAYARIHRDDIEDPMGPPSRYI